MRNSARRRTASLWVAAALALSAVGCGSSQYALRDSADRTMSAQVGARLAAAPDSSFAKIRARAHWGVIALVGEVTDESSRLEAGRIAGAVEGVRRVDNLIQVVKDDSKAEGSAPAAAVLNMTRTD